MSSSLDSDPRPESPGSGTIPEPVWGPLVERVQRGDTQAMAELYQTFLRGIRYYLCRHLGPEDLDDKVHDSYVIVVQAIQRGEIRDPEKLLGFVRTVARRQVAAHIDQAIQSRREVADQEVGARIPSGASTPEQKLLREEQKELMQKVLRGISARDREILTRFYLYEQPQQQICEEMGLTETQFRLLKSRAKARFGAMGKRRLAPPGANRDGSSGSPDAERGRKDWLGKVFLRKVAASGH